MSTPNSSSPPHPPSAIAPARNNAPPPIRQSIVDVAVPIATASVNVAQGVEVDSSPDFAIPHAMPVAKGLRPILVEPTEDELLAIESHQDDDALPDVAVAVAVAPPWLVSLVVHMAGMIVLGLLFLPGLIRQDISIEAIFGETFGEQLDEETVQFVTEDPDEQLAIAKDMTEVDDPLAAPPEVQLDFGGRTPTLSNFSAPNVGLALSGREEGMKEALLLAYGGNATTEGSVALALQWLAKNQRRDGSWSLRGPYGDGASTENPLAATAMALLAFQGAGFTHQSGRPFVNSRGEKEHFDYQRVVRRGWNAMLKWQDKDGSFWKKGEVSVRHHRLYSQAQAMIAICELYGMSKDSEFRRPAQLAVDYAVKIQDELGGWRYEPGSDSDTSVTGWFVMGLQSARMAGLDVPSEVFEKVSAFLDMVTDDGGSRYGYMPQMNSKPAMTAEALLCRQYLGWRQNDERLTGGVKYLENYPIDWSEPNTYHWYYATQVMHHMEGDAWEKWNRVMRQDIPSKQVTKGKERGSWSPDGDRWAGHAGRLYMTCLCTYMLEVYYRHLPIYSDVYLTP